jgi:hypothetical protein
MLLVVCTTSMYVKAEEIPLPAIEAYQKAVEILVEMGVVPSFRDNELRLIKTDSTPTKLSGEECDCGKMFGIPYMKDKRVKTGVAYQVRFKKIDDKTCNMDLKITIDGYMDVNEGAPFFIEKTKNNNKILMCKSTGLLEKRFRELLLKD